MDFHRRTVILLRFAFNLFLFIYELNTRVNCEPRRANFRLFPDSGPDRSTKYSRKKHGFGISTQNPTRCGTLCMYTPLCVGYFFKENEFCLLVSTPQNNNLTSESGTSYYQTTNLCSNNPCNVAQCISTNNGLAYICQNEYYILSDDQDALYTLNGGTCYPATAHGIILYSTHNNQLILNYRFRLEGISKTHTLTSAKLILTSNSNRNAFSYDIKIKAMKRANSLSNINACDFKESSGRTNAQVLWGPSHPATTVGTVIESPDISSIINEVISLDGWVEGNYIDIMFFNDDLNDIADSPTSSYYFYSGVHGSTDKTKAPKLVVEFQ